MRGLHYIYSSSKIMTTKSRRIGGRCRAHGEMKNAYHIFIVKSEGKMPIGKN
jgi:hypothetical protein